MQGAISYLTSIHPLSPTLVAELRRLCRSQKVTKSQLLVSEGAVCKYAWYLHKGLVRCFYEQDEHEVTPWFMEEGHVLLLFDSLFEQRESLYNLEALENCELSGIHYDDLLHLLEIHHELRQIRSNLAGQYSNLKDTRIRITGMLSAPKRYQYFEKQFPRLLNRVKLDHIASYLDISRRSVVRARSLTSSPSPKRP